MTLRLSSVCRDSALQALTQMLQVIYIYAGTQPATPESPMDAGTELATFYVQGQFSTLKGGVLSLIGKVEGTATGSGVAGWARWTYPQSPTTAIDGAVGLEGATDVEFFLSSLTIVAGNPVSLSGLVVTFPM